MERGVGDKGRNKGSERHLCQGAQRYNESLLVAEPEEAELDKILGKEPDPQEKEPCERIIIGSLKEENVTKWEGLCDYTDQTNEALINSPEEKEEEKPTSVDIKEEVHNNDSNVCGSSESSKSIKTEPETSKIQLFKANAPVVKDEPESDDERPVRSSSDYVLDHTTVDLYGKYASYASGDEYDNHSECSSTDSSNLLNWVDNSDTDSNSSDESSGEESDFDKFLPFQSAVADTTKQSYVNYMTPEQPPLYHHLISSRSGMVVGQTTGFRRRGPSATQVLMP